MLFKKLAFVWLKELHLVLESTLETRTGFSRKNLREPDQEPKKSNSVLEPDPLPPENVSGFWNRTDQMI